MQHGLEPENCGNHRRAFHHCDRRQPRGLSAHTGSDRQFTSAGAADRASLQAIGDMLVSLRSHASLSAVFAFSLGGFLYYYVFFQSRLIPRWLSGWGILAAILMLVACMLALFSDSPVSGYIPLAFPIFLQEMVLAVWLIVKGFSPAVSAAEPGRIAGEMLPAMR
jgi:hypothetical protein